MIVILMVATVAYFAFAAEQKDEMMGKEVMGQVMLGMCPMHTMMCQGMMQKEMVATEDGGVIIMAYNKLCKYDKDLNLVKEVELKIDIKAMQDKMQQMMKECVEKCQMMKPQEKTAGEKSGSM
jgi:hypothetical protein